jgi:hypothetical protein
VITKRHQGSLICQTAPGEGTTFTIEIPLKQSPSGPEACPGNPIEMACPTDGDRQLS